MNQTARTILAWLGIILISVLFTSLLGWWGLIPCFIVGVIAGLTPYSLEMYPFLKKYR